MKRLLILLAAAGILAACSEQAADQRLLNVSYDPTRELYQQINKAFADEQKALGNSVTITNSHGGSGARHAGLILYPIRWRCSGHE